MKIISNFVDGKAHQEESSNFISLYKPTTGEEYAQVPITSKDSFQKIIEKMKNAQISWSETPVTVSYTHLTLPTKA